MRPITAAPSLDLLPAHARVWVYKSAVAFSPEQIADIRARGAHFTSTWAAHGAKLDAVVEVLHDHFVVIAVDEEQAQASGCSIDKSVHFIRELERDLGLVLTDRMVVFHEKDGTLESCRVPEVADLLQRGELTPDSIVYDDLVSSVGDLQSAFRTPLKSSWLARFL